MKKKLAGNITNDSKSFYAYVRSKQKVQDKVGPLENNSENIISDGFQILGLIRRTITYKEKELIVPLYKAIVRPHLEFCIQAWRLYRKKDIDKLDRIQRRATKMIPELRDLNYKNRLLQCGLTTLETRRLRGDQIEVFKIVNGYEDVDRNMFFKLKEGSRTRGHKAALVK